MFEPLFGDLFDLNGDGTATFEEELFGLIITDEMEKTIWTRVDPFESDDFNDAFGEDFGSDDF